MMYIPKDKFALHSNGSLGPSVQSCEWSGCLMNGKYRAPKSKTKIREYRWFCMEHVRIYNKSWNYYEGMTDIQLEKFIRSDTTWNRPTWPIGDGYNQIFSTKNIEVGLENINNIFDFFSKKDTYKKSTFWEPNASPTAQEKKALSLLNLDVSVTIAELRIRYKFLVKQCHPDVTCGDKKLEERFKQIKEAYDIIITYIATD
jgi:hypothetical protein